MYGHYDLIIEMLHYCDKTTSLKYTWTGLDNIIDTY